MFFCRIWTSALRIRLLRATCQVAVCTRRFVCSSPGPRRDHQPLEAWIVICAFPISFPHFLLECWWLILLVPNTLTFSSSPHKPPKGGNWGLARRSLLSLDCGYWCQSGDHSLPAAPPSPPGQFPQSASTFSLLTDLQKRLQLPVLGKTYAATRLAQWSRPDLRDTQFPFWSGAGPHVWLVCHGRPWNANICILYRH